MSRLANGLSSAQNVVHDLAVDIRQTEITTGVSIRQLCVIDAELVQDRGVQIVKMDLVLDRVVPVLIGFSVRHPATNAASGHPHRKSVRIVVATISVFGCRSASEFSAPDNQGFFKQSSRLEILEQSGDGFVD